ncbi:MAG: hypothetical protein LEGION0398_MBIBDBAK_00158 [Legionellaceae bacterium]
MGKNFDICKEIKKVNVNGKNKELSNFFKDNISNKNITITEIFEYAKNKQYHLIDAKLINEIGVFISGLDSNYEDKNMWINLCEIAAKKDSIHANESCALYYIDEFNYGVVDIIKSLKYANKMMELSKNSNEFKLTYAKVLFNNNFQEFSEILMQYFDYKYKLYCNGIDVYSDLYNAGIFAQNSIGYLLNSIGNIDNKTIENFIKILSYFKTDYNQLLINNLNNTKIFNSNKNLSDYYKKIIKDNLNKTFLSSIMLQKEQENSSTLLFTEFNQDCNLVLSDNFILPSQVKKHWKKDAEWFYSVKKSEINNEFKMHDEKLDKLINEKLAEIEAIKETGVKEKLFENEIALKQLYNARENLKQKHYELTPEYRKKYRRYAAERNFFNPTRNRSNKKESLINLTEDIIEQRFNYAANNSIKPVNLAGKSSRLFITAERVFQETVNDLLPGQSMSCIPTMRQQSWSYGNGSNNYGPIEKYKVNETEIKAEHRTNPKPQRLGDSFLPDHGTYDGDIYPLLRKLSQGDSEKEKIIATYFLRYGKTHQGISLEEVQALLADATEEDVHRFNRICFLIMEKEQGQWHLAADPRFHLGMSVSQARCLILLEKGHLSLEDVFKNNVLFGVYSKTQINNYPEKVAEACRYIDVLYLEYLKTKNSHEYLSFFKKNIKENHTLVLTRKQAHEDLKYVYGGESDTDSEGYDSDLSLS